MVDVGVGELSEPTALFLEIFGLLTALASNIPIRINIPAPPMAATIFWLRVRLASTPACYSMADAISPLNALLPK